MWEALTAFRADGFPPTARDRGLPAAISVNLKLPDVLRSDRGKKETAAGQDHPARFVDGRDQPLVPR